MSAVQPAVEMPQPAPIPRLLVDLPSRPRVFLDNFRDLVLPPRLAPLVLQSAPAAFWADVFVTHRVPWNRFLQSVAYHVVGGALVLGLAHFFALQPRLKAEPAFDRSQVVHYQASEYLPRLDTRRASAAQPHPADPAFSRQPIISVPRESDNDLQTIVTPPRVKLKRDLRLPNMVAWSDRETKPRLEIPAAPLIPAAEIKRLSPRLETSVVTPPPDAERLVHHRNLPALESAVVAPAPEVHSANRPVLVGLQPSLIAPPPKVEDVPTRRVGDLNIAASSVIAPAPSLPVAAQRTLPGGGLGVAGAASQVVAPPPSLAAGSPAGASGRVVALNLQPAVGAPPAAPEGNRRGAFAVTPEGHTGASGTPGSSSPGSGNGSGGARKSTSELPDGLYVGGAPANTSPVAGSAANHAASSVVNPNLIASVRPPRVTTSRSLQPGSAAKLSEPERAVFGNRRFYSLTLNMPNLNSSGGSWVIRFAELKHAASNGDANAAEDISQPTATRKVDPAYPLQVMRENVSGTVILYAVIHADGSVGNVHVLRGVDDRLDRFARDAVAQWKFDPATKDGTPVDVEATFQVPFKPPKIGTNF